MLPSPAGGDPSKKNKYVDVVKGGGDQMKKGGPTKRLIPVKEPNLSSESDSDKENRNPTLPTKRNKESCRAAGILEGGSSLLPESRTVAVAGPSVSPTAVVYRIPKRYYSKVTFLYLNFRFLAPFLNFF